MAAKARKAEAGCRIVGRHAHQPCHQRRDHVAFKTLFVRERSIWQIQVAHRRWFEIDQWCVRDLIAIAFRMLAVTGRTL